MKKVPYRVNDVAKFLKAQQAALDVGHTEEEARQAGHCAVRGEIFITRQPEPKAVYTPVGSFDW